MEGSNLLKFISYRSVTNRIAVHTLVWTVFLFSVFIYQYISSGRPGFWIIVREDIPFTILDVIFTYLVLYLIDKFLLRGKLMVFFLMLSGAMTLDFIAYKKTFQFVLTAFRPGQDIETLLGSVDDFSIIFSLSFPIAVFSVLHIFRRWMFAQTDMAELAKQNLQRELDILKTQLNQHFLFNTLNNIDSLIFYNPQLASKTIIDLSGLLRYSLYETNQDRIPMFQEIEYLKQYLSVGLVRIRQGKGVDIKVIGRYSDVLIAPMLFLPFVENTLKHADRKRIDEIEINFVFSGTNLKFRTYNLKKQNAEKLVAGLGIKNARRRLELIYPEKHKLKIIDKADTYEVILEIETA